MRHLGTITNKDGDLYEITDSYKHVYDCFSVQEFQIGNKVIFKKYPQVEIIQKSTEINHGFEDQIQYLEDTQEISENT